MSADMIWSQRPMASAFLARLRRSPELGAADLSALTQTDAEIRTFNPHSTIVAESARGDCVHVLLEGWAARTKMLGNGSRQIPALFVAGDICDLSALHLERGDNMAIALTRVTMLLLPREALHLLIDRHRGLRAAIYRALATELSIATQWTVCLGRRSARERLAHLLCELYVRLEAVGAASALPCTLPLTQEELADVLGLTAVHVNRTLQALRSDQLIQLREQRLVITDWVALKRTAGFDPVYLHLAEDAAVSGAGQMPPHAEMRLSA